MPRIEQYALIGDMQTVALVSADGSIDWLCLPRFDSGACFAAILGGPEHGRWRITPRAPVVRTRRRYRPSSLVLETEFDTAAGTVRIVDCMPPRAGEPDLVRLVEGVSGEVEVELELIVRFDYGSVIPWVRRIDGALRAIGGPDAVSFWSPVPVKGEAFTTRARFTVKAGEALPFVLMWHPSHEPPPPPIDGREAAADTERWWRDWARQFTYEGPWREQVLRSAITLKALTYAPTGGIVAAPTTSLPEHIGGVRNWDYRFCWLRDATFTLLSLVSCGFRQEAAAWRDWLLRAVAGDPSTLQIMYGPAGERRLPEFEVPWLPGFEHSRPVRVGNAASGQLQLDVYGEVMDALFQASRHGLPPDAAAWSLQRVMLEFLETGWSLPDEGVWEVRGPRRHFTHSKVLAWVAFDRGVKVLEQGRLDGPLARWRTIRDAIHADVCAHAFDTTRGTFTQSYGSRELDASLLQIPMVGFLPPEDTRVRGTIAAVERELSQEGFVRRYSTSAEGEVDGLPAGEGAFLPCSFWLADCYALTGRHEDARVLFERLLGIANDVGLLSEEYDPVAQRLLGNFPQAWSHVCLIDTALNLGRRDGPAEHRGG